MRTSIDSPLRIGAVRPPGLLGLIGITFCPGKKQQGAQSCSWDRDLELDLDETTKWGARAVVTLLEPHEIEELGVQGLPHAVKERGMEWFHAPITAGSTPGPEFESSWATIGQKVRSILREGGSVLIHCESGLGRAGTVAACLLVELGVEPEAAIHDVRSVRGAGAIETLAQERYVRSCSSAPE